ncbi:MAG: sigma 54-interacting transcriptional regulator [Pseudomonadota bacterium]
MRVQVVGEHEDAARIGWLLQALRIESTVQTRFTLPDSSAAQALGGEPAIVLLPPYDTSTLPEDVPVVVAVPDGVPPPDVPALLAIAAPYVFDELIAALRVLRASRTLADELWARGLDESSLAALQEFPGEHPVLDTLRQDICRCAGADGATLIRGEMGSGRRLVGSIVHRCSTRSSGPFIPVSCAAFPDALLPVELFGAEADSLPGVQGRRIGRLELASGGVLLLEDIEALNLQSQATLLAFLRSKRLERIGASRGIACDTRVLACSSADLEALVEAGSFREDLYYALQTETLRVPPLREYCAALRDVFMHIESTFTLTTLAEESWALLERYQWPGNLAEARNFIRQVLLLSDGRPLEVEDLPSRIAVGASVTTAAEAALDSTLPMLPVNGLDLKEYLSTLEKHLIVQALEDTRFVVARAADRLQVRRTTLVEKMRKYGLQRS